jgi:hypothetical protein
MKPAPCTSQGLGRWWLAPLCWLLGHNQRWSPDDSDRYCRTCGKTLICPKTDKSL